MALGTIVPNSEAKPIRNVAAKGAFSTITPLSLSFTSTRSSVGKRAAQSDFSMRSKENFTSSAVTSPPSLVHIRPGFSVKEMVTGSSCVIFSTYSDGTQPHLPSACLVGTARRGRQANWIVVSAPPIM